MPIKLNSTGGGSVSIDVPSTASSYTLTAPARTGTIITSADANTVTQSMIQTGFAGNGPSFSAYVSVAQTLSSTTWTKVTPQTEEWDTANCFDNVTNYRFTPNVAGYYHFNMSAAVATSQCAVGIQLYKNGSGYKYPFYLPTGNITDCSALAYANGSTDYFEFYLYFGVGQNLYASATSSYFQGYMVRSA